MQAVNIGSCPRIQCAQQFVSAVMPSIELWTPEPPDSQRIRAYITASRHMRAWRAAAGAPHTATAGEAVLRVPWPARAKLHLQRAELAVVPVEI